MSTNPFQFLKPAPYVSQHVGLPLDEMRYALERKNESYQQNIQTMDELSMFVNSISAYEKDGSAREIIDQARSRLDSSLDALSDMPFEEANPKARNVIRTLFRDTMGDKGLKQVSENYEKSREYERVANEMRAQGLSVLDWSDDFSSVSKDADGNVTYNSLQNPFRKKQPWEETKANILSTYLKEEYKGIIPENFDMENFDDLFDVPFIKYMQEKGISQDELMRKLSGVVDMYVGTDAGTQELEDTTRKFIAQGMSREEAVTAAKNQIYDSVAGIGKLMVGTTKTHSYEVNPYYHPGGNSPGTSDAFYTGGDVGGDGVGLNTQNPQQTTEKEIPNILNSTSKKDDEKKKSLYTNSDDNGGETTTKAKIQSYTNLLSSSYEGTDKTYEDVIKEEFPEAYVAATKSGTFNAGEFIHNIGKRKSVTIDPKSKDAQVGGMGFTHYPDIKTDPVEQNIRDFVSFMATGENIMEVLSENFFEGGEVDIREIPFLKPLADKSKILDAFKQKRDKTGQNLFSVEIDADDLPSVEHAKKVNAALRLAQDAAKSTALEYYKDDVASAGEDVIFKVNQINHLSEKGTKLNTVLTTIVDNSLLAGTYKVLEDLKAEKAGERNKGRDLKIGKVNQIVGVQVVKGVPVVQMRANVARGKDIENNANIVVEITDRNLMSNMIQHIAEHNPALAQDLAIANEFRHVRPHRSNSSMITVQDGDIFENVPLKDYFAEYGQNLPEGIGLHNLPGNKFEIRVNGNTVRWEQIGADGTPRNRRAEYDRNDVHHAFKLLMDWDNMFKGTASVDVPTQKKSEDGTKQTAFPIDEPVVEKPSTPVKEQPKQKENIEPGKTEKPSSKRSQLTNPVSTPFSPKITERTSSKGDTTYLMETPAGKKVVLSENEAEVVSTRAKELERTLAQPTKQGDVKYTSPSQATPSLYYKKEELQSKFTNPVNIFDSNGYRNEESESVLTKGAELINTPTYIILHHTGHQENQTFDSIHNQFMNSGDANAHMLIGEDGTINVYASPYQIMAHAGESSWGADKDGQPKDRLNRKSIGIEIFNRDTTKYPISEQQVQSAAEAISMYLEDIGGSLDNVLTHEMIAPNRKIDVAPKEYLRVIDKLRAMGHKFKDKTLEEKILSTASEGTLRTLNEFYYNHSKAKGQASNNMPKFSDYSPF